jgi:MFS family permease
VFGANISVATAYIGDVTEAEERTRYMGLVGASYGIGFTLGPLIGGGLSVFGHGVPMIFAAGLAATNFVFASVILQEPERHNTEAEALTEREALDRGKFLRRLAWINFIFTFAVTQLESMFIYYMITRFSYSMLEVTPIMFLMAFVMAGIQGGGIKPLAQRFGERKLLLGGVTLMAAAFLAVPAPASVGLLLVPLVLSAVGRAVSQPSMLSMVSFEATPETRGAVMGRFQSAASAARTIGPLVAGVLFDWQMGLPFWFAGILMLIAIPLVLGVVQDDSRHAT